MYGNEPRPNTVVYSAKTWMKNEQEAVPSSAEGDWKFLVGLLTGVTITTVAFTLKLVLMVIG